MMSQDPSPGVVRDIGGPPTFPLDQTREYKDELRTRPCAWTVVPTFGALEEAVYDLARKPSGAERGAVPRLRDDLLAPAGAARPAHPVARVAQRVRPRCAAVERVVVAPRRHGLGAPLRLEAL